MNSKQLAVIAAKQQIQTREQFHAALAHVNELVRQPDIEVAEAKAAMTKAEALRAWASFDKRRTVEEKKEANRAMTRTVRMLVEVATREQPGGGKGKGNGKGSKQGPHAWLQRELRLLRSTAAAMRSLVSRPDLYRTVLTEGRHWASAVSMRRRGACSTLARTAEMVRTVNTLESALKIPPHFLARELSRIRKIRAWCEAYEHALLQRKAGLAK